MSNHTMDQWWSQIKWTFFFMAIVFLVCVIGSFIKRDATIDNSLNKKLQQEFIDGYKHGLESAQCTSTR